MTNYGDWIRARLREKKLTQRALGEHLGLHESIVSRIIAGTRTLSALELDQISMFVGAAPPNLSTTVVPRENSATLSPPATLRTIPIMAIVAAGVYRERGAVVVDNRQVPASPDPRLRTASQYACRVDGPEYGALAGQYAICVPYAVVRAQPGVTDTVHVIRTRGDLEEHSLRSVAIDGQGVQLMRLNDPTDVLSAADPLVQIAGLVVGFFAALSY